MEIFGIAFFPYFHKKIDEIFSNKVRCHDPRSNINKRKYLFQIPGGEEGGGATTVPISCIGLVIIVVMFSSIFLHCQRKFKGKNVEKKGGMEKMGRQG